jgi:hypothetical protein
MQGSVTACSAFFFSSAFPLLSLGAIHTPALLVLCFFPFVLLLLLLLVMLRTSPLDDFIMINCDLWVVAGYRHPYDVALCTWCCQIHERWAVRSAGALGDNRSSPTCFYRYIGPVPFRQPLEQCMRAMFAAAIQSLGILNTLTYRVGK